MTLECHQRKYECVSENSLIIQIKLKFSFETKRLYTGGTVRIIRRNSGQVFEHKHEPEICVDSKYGNMVTFKENLVSVKYVFRLDLAFRTRK